MTQNATWRARRGSGTSRWAAVVAVIIVVVVASVFVVERGVSTSTETSTSSPNSTSTGTPPSLNGLKLALTLNSSTISSGQGIAATVEDLNTMTTPLNISAAADWPIGGLSTGPCGSLNYPIGIAVLKGNYELANVSSVNALQIYQPGPYACPMILSDIEGFYFQPSSDNATVLGSCQPEASGCFSETVNSTVTFSGYYSGTTFTPFPAGTYTVVAGDEWGDIVVLHFLVA
jgi:hypothetical protein